MHQARIMATILHSQQSAQPSSTSSANSTAIPTPTSGIKKPPAPRKFRNKFVPSFQNPTKPKQSKRRRNNINSSSSSNSSNSNSSNSSSNNINTNINTNINPNNNNSSAVEIQKVSNVVEQKYPSTFTSVSALRQGLTSTQASVVTPVSGPTPVSTSASSPSLSLASALASASTTSTCSSATSVLPSVSAPTKAFSSQYVDYLIEIEKTEKKRLEELDIKSNIQVDSSLLSSSNPAPVIEACLASDALLSIPFNQFGFEGSQLKAFEGYHPKYATKALSIGDPFNRKLWDTYTPQLASRSPMVAKALLAYDALYISRIKDRVNPTLESLASEYFFNSIKELSQAVSDMKTRDSLEIYVTSYLVAAFAIAIPNEVPVVSVDQTKPELFRIIRGVFSSYYKTLTGDFSYLKCLLPPSCEIPQNLDKVDLDTMAHPKVALLKLLWDQIDSLESGSKSLDILSNPSAVDIDNFASSETGDFMDELPFNFFSQQHEGFGDFENFPVIIQNSPSTSSHNSDSVLNSDQASPTNSFSPLESYSILLDPSSTSFNELNSDNNDAATTSSAHANFMYSHQAPSSGNSKSLEDPESMLFQFLPGEVDCYRKAVYELITVIHRVNKVKSTTVLLFLFNVVTDEFMVFLRQRRPMALVILAYVFSIFWFKDKFLGNEGTYLRRMQEVESMAPESWKCAFYWPKEILENSRLHKSLEEILAELTLDQ